MTQATGVAGPLEDLVPGVWVQRGWKRFYGGLIQRWMTVVRLGDGRLWVHSPNTLTPELRAELEALGEVGCVVSPNALHGHMVDVYAQAFPDAVVFGAPGVRERHPRLPIGRVLSAAPEPEWAGVLDQTLVAGNALFTEALFLHRASGTLIVTDLLENIFREDVGLMWRIGVRLFSKLGRPAPAPEHGWFLVDPDAFERSLEAVRGWEYERILPAHGRIIERDARAAFEGLVERTLRAARRRGPLRRSLLRALAKLE